MGAGREKQRRTGQFRWEARMELYDYFGTHYNLKPEAIDIEIEAVMDGFKERKGCPIDPRELWQKVGTEVERRLKRQGG